MNKYPGYYKNCELTLKDTNYYVPEKIIKMVLTVLDLPNIAVVNPRECVFTTVILRNLRNLYNLKVPFSKLKINY